MEWLGTAERIIALAAVLGTIALALWKWVHLPMTERLNGFGRRLNEAERETAALDGRVDKLERDGALSDMDRKNLHESVSRISVEMQTLVKLTQELQLERAEGLTEIRERLVRIETKIDTGGRS